MIVCFFRDVKRFFRKKAGIPDGKPAFFERPKIIKQLSIRFLRVFIEHCINILGDGYLQRSFKGF